MNDKYSKKWNGLKDNSQIVRYIDSLPQVQNNAAKHQYEATALWKRALETGFDGTAGMNKKHFKRPTGQTQIEYIKVSLATDPNLATQIENALCDPENQTDWKISSMLAILSQVLISPSRTRASDEALFEYIYGLPEVQENHRGKFKNLSNQASVYIGADGLLTEKKSKKKAKGGDSKTLDYSYTLTDANGETQTVFFAHKSRRSNGGGQGESLKELEGTLGNTRNTHVVLILEGEGNNSYEKALERKPSNPFYHVCNSIPEAIRLAESLYPQEITCK